MNYTTDLIHNPIDLLIEKKESSKEKMIHRRLKAI